MLSIAVKGLDDVKKAFKQDAKQHRYAASLALTRTARQAADDQKAQAEKELDRPTPFTKRGFRYRKATKAKLQSAVYIAPIQAEYLFWAVEGGRRPGRSKKGEALPVGIRMNKYGNIPGRWKGKIRKLINRPNTFVETINGVHGVWQRFKGRLKLLIRFHKSTKYDKQLKFYKTADKSFYRRYDREFDKALSQALRTAR